MESQFPLQRKVTRRIHKQFQLKKTTIEAGHCELHQAERGRTKQFAKEDELTWNNKRKGEQIEWFRGQRSVAEKFLAWNLRTLIWSWWKANAAWKSQKPSKQNDPLTRRMPPKTLPTYRIKPVARQTQRKIRLSDAREQQLEVFGWKNGTRKNQTGLRVSQADRTALRDCWKFKKIVWKPEEPNQGSGRLKLIHRGTSL